MGPNARLSNTLTRGEVLQFICSAASYGNLGLFVGAGLSKAVLNADSEIALSWGQLLQRVSDKLGVNYPEIVKDGASYPEIASRICQEYASSNGILFRQAVNHLKGSIAELTCWYPTQEQREVFGNYLRALSPAWIITTNYDLVIEAILTGNSIPLGPADLARGKGAAYTRHQLTNRFRFVAEPLQLSSEQFTLVIQRDALRPQSVDPFSHRQASDQLSS